MTKSKVISISDKDIIQLLSENNPELLQETFRSIEKQFQEEAEGAVPNPPRQKLYKKLCEELKEIAESMDGDIFIITQAEEKDLRHYVDVNIPNQTLMSGEIFQRFVKCLKQFDSVHLDVNDNEDNTVTFGLGFIGAWVKEES